MLVEIANGGRYYPPEYRRRFLFFNTIVQEEIWEYGLEAQLAAIEALSHTGSREALRYMGRLSEYRREEVYHWGSRTDPYAHYDECTYYHTFPNAKGRLNEALKYSIFTDNACGGRYDKIGFNDDVHLIVEQSLWSLRIWAIMHYEIGVCRSCDFFGDVWTTGDPFVGRIGILSLSGNEHSFRVKLGVAGATIESPRHGRAEELNSRFLRNMDRNLGSSFSAYISPGDKVDIMCVLVFEKGLLVSAEKTLTPNMAYRGNR